MKKVFFFHISRIHALFKQVPFIIVFLLLPGSALSQDTAPPRIETSRADLVIIDSAGKKQQMTPRDLSVLPWTTVTTHTAWTEGPREFEGVLMRDVLSAAGIEVEPRDTRSVEAIALNDYRVSIPIRDFIEFDVLLARKMDGKPMTRRDKGPYWIIYPRDENPELEEPHFDHRWVWQLWQLKVK